MMMTTDAIDALLDDETIFSMLRILIIDPDAALNDCMIDDDALDRDIADLYTDLRATAATLRTDDHRELLTYAALALSLCPLHLIDYAICFDDDDADCAAIRTIHPSHDS